jgi:hypothetical protein
MDELRKPERLLSVNWEDGMLVKASHLTEQEGYFENLNRWVAEHAVNFFGLTRPPRGQTSALEIRVDHDGQNWAVILSRCYALTPNGRIIQIDSQYDNAVKSAAVLAKSPDAVPVYLHAKQGKIGIGLPGRDSEPTRHPYRGYDYEILVGGLKDADPADCLKVGEIKFADSRPELSADYIPPCMIIGSHALLAEQCRRLHGLLTLVQQSAIDGFQAFISVSQDKPGKFGIEHRWFEDMLAGLSIQLGGMLKTHPAPELPIAPYYLISYYQQVFGTVDAMMETYREAALTLRKKFSDNEAFKRFLDGIKEFPSSKYNHYELGPQCWRLIRLMNDFVEFINLLKSLAGALPQVGLIMNYRNREYRLQSFGAIKSQVERDGVTIKIEGLANVVSRDVIVGVNREIFSGADYRYIMVKIGLNENSIPGRMDPVYVDAETSTGSLIMKPMDDLAAPSIGTINLNFRGNFNPQDLKSVANEMINVYVY